MVLRPEAQLQHSNGWWLRSAPKANVAAASVVATLLPGIALGLQHFEVVSSSRIYLAVLPALLMLLFAVQLHTSSQSSATQQSVAFSWLAAATLLSSFVAVAMLFRVAGQEPAGQVAALLVVLNVLGGTVGGYSISRAPATIR